MPWPMGSIWFRIPLALSSVLAALGTLQLRAVGILNHVDPLVSSSNYYRVMTMQRGNTIAILDSDLRPSSFLNLSGYTVLDIYAHALP